MNLLNEAIYLHQQSARKWLEAVHELRYHNPDEMAPLV